MLRVKVDNTILDRLKSLLADEPEGTCIRLREYVIGAG